MILKVNVMAPFDLVLPIFEQIISITFKDTGPLCDGTKFLFDHTKYKFLFKTTYDAVRK